MGVSGWPAETAGKYSVRRSGKLYKKHLEDLRTFSCSCTATALAEFSSGPVSEQLQHCETTTNRHRRIGRRAKSAEQPKRKAGILVVSMVYRVFVFPNEKYTNT